MGLETIRVFTWRTAAMLLFTGAESPMHEHVTAQLSFALEEQSRVRTADGDWVEAPGILVPQGMAHGYDATEGLHFVLWIEPDGLAGRAIKARYPEERIHLFDEAEVAELRREVRDALDAGFGPDEATRIRDIALETLAGELPRPEGRIDPRVRRAIQIMNDPGGGELSVDELAARVGVSESHLSHLFSDQVGVPVSRYRMWLRALKAARALSSGSSITDAAHVAGFSDGAHLSRTFKRLFGQTPSAAVGGAIEMYAIDEEP